MLDICGRSDHTAECDGHVIDPDARAPAARQWLCPAAGAKPRVLILKNGIRAHVLLLASVCWDETTLMGLCAILRASYEAHKVRIAQDNTSR